MLDIRNETMLRLADAADHLPPRRGGAKPHATTLYRWAKGGYGSSTWRRFALAGRFAPRWKRSDAFATG